MNMLVMLPRVLQLVVVISSVKVSWSITTWVDSFADVTIGHCWRSSFTTPKVGKESELIKSICLTKVLLDPSGDVANRGICRSSPIVGKTSGLGDLTIWNVELFDLALLLVFPIDSSWSSRLLSFECVLEPKSPY